MRRDLWNPSSELIPQTSGVLDALSFAFWVCIVFAVFIIILMMSVYQSTIRR